MRFLFIFFLFSQSLFSQELNCRININYSAIPSPNKEMFNSMRQSIYEFINIQTGRMICLRMKNV